MKDGAHHDLIETLTREALSRFRVPADARVQCYLIHHNKLVLLPKASPLRKRYRLYEYPARNEFRALKGTRFILLIDTSASELELSVLPYETSQFYSLPYKSTRGRIVFGQPQKVLVCG